MNITQWLIPAGVIGVAAIVITILEKLLPKMLRIKEPVAGVSYSQSQAIPLNVYVPKPWYRLWFMTVGCGQVKWFDETDPNPIASGVGGVCSGKKNRTAELPVGTHTITVKAPGFIPAQVTIEVA